jgi:hypothetical protein
VEPLAVFWVRLENSLGLYMVPFVGRTCRSDFSPTAGLAATTVVGLKSDLHLSSFLVPMRHMGTKEKFRLFHPRQSTLKETPCNQ